jgi:hypothetical protein
MVKHFEIAISIRIGFEDVSLSIARFGMDLVQGATEFSTENALLLLAESPVPLAPSFESFGTMKSPELEQGRISWFMQLGFAARVGNQVSRNSFILAY